MRRRRKYRKSKEPLKIIVLLIICFFLLFKVGVITEDHVKIAIAIMIGIPVLYLLRVFVKKKVKKYRYLHSDLYRIDRMDGVEFEQYLKAHFENLGYHVKTTPTTADYGVDLICKRQGECIAVQAKRYRDKIGISAVQEVIGGMNYYDCTYGMVVTNSYFTKNAQELAEKSNVVLWDRDVISKIFHIHNKSKSNKLQ